MALNLRHEKKLFSQGYASVIGIDEAGRGPLAGPVAAAAILLPSHFAIPQELKAVYDSKKLSPELREKLYQAIITHPDISWAISKVWPTTIDRINIYQATLLAMSRCIEKLSPQQKAHILIDGNALLPQALHKQQAIPKGDQKNFSIAAASIVAKVARDRTMQRLHNDYPQYNFSQHKGYGTKAHIAAIRKHGPSPYHRHSFLKNILY